jgi:predicted membrane-bound spermidine synthase
VSLLPPQFESRLFFAVGLFLISAGIVYAIFADDDAGTVLLVAGGIFAWITGWYVGRHQLPTLADVERQEWGEEASRLYGPPVADQPAGDHLYLPPGSIWPSVMAAGLTLMLTGFAIGLWILIPGLLVFVPGLIGFVAEGRARR